MNLPLGVGGLARLAKVVDGDVCAVLRKANGDRLADARRAAGDENVLALEPSHAFRGGRCGDGAWHGIPLLDFGSSAVQGGHMDCVSEGPAAVTSRAWSAGCSSAASR